MRTPRLIVTISALFPVAFFLAILMDAHDCRGSEFSGGGAMAVQDGGAGLERPHRGDRVSNGWLRAGAAFTLGLGGAGGDVSSASGPRLRWKFGAGLTVVNVGRWSMAHSMRYRSRPGDHGVDGATVPVDRSSAAFELDIRFGF